MMFFLTTYATFQPATLESGVQSGTYGGTGTSKDPKLRLRATMYPHFRVTGLHYFAGEAGHRDALLRPVF